MTIEYSRDLAELCGLRYQSNQEQFFNKLCTFLNRHANADDLRNSAFFNSVIEDLLTYFEDKEQYEKCHLLKGFLCY